MKSYIINRKYTNPVTSLRPVPGREVHLGLPTEYKILNILFVGVVDYDGNILEGSAQLGYYDEDQKRVYVFGKEPLGGEMTVMVANGFTFPEAEDEDDPRRGHTSPSLKGQNPKKSRGEYLQNGNGLKGTYGWEIGGEIDITGTPIAAQYGVIGGSTTHFKACPITESLYSGAIDERELRKYLVTGTDHERDGRLLNVYRELEKCTGDSVTDKIADEVLTYDELLAAAERVIDDLRLGAKRERLSEIEKSISELERTLLTLKSEKAYLEGQLAPKRSIPPIAIDPAVASSGAGGAGKKSNLLRELSVGDRVKVKCEGRVGVVKLVEPGKKLVHIDVGGRSLAYRIEDVMREDVRG